MCKFRKISEQLEEVLRLKEEAKGLLTKKEAAIKSFEIYHSEVTLKRMRSDVNA